MYVSWCYLHSKLKNVDKGQMIRWKQDKEVLKIDPLIIRGWRGFSQIFLTTLSCFFEGVPKDTSDDDVVDVQNLPHYSACFSPDILKKKVSFQVWPSEQVCESKNGTLTEYPLWRGWSTLPLRGRPSPFSVVFPFVKKREACSWSGKSKRLRRCCLDP